jgi:hypothetical protein
MYKHGSAPTPRGKRITWPLAAICALVVLFGAAPAARSETVTLGHLAVTNPKNGCTSCHFLQVASDPATAYVVPAGQWTISSWSGLGGEKVGVVRLDVYRPTTFEGQYEPIAKSEYESVPAGTESTFPVAIAVQGGDMIGLSTGADGYPPLIDMYDEADTTGSVIGSPSLFQPVGNGTGFPVNTSNGRNLNIEVTLTRPDPVPVISAPGPEPAPTCVVSPAACAPVPAGHLKLGKQRHKHGSAIVTQKITLSAPGTVAISGKGIAPRHVRIATAGPITVGFAPKGGLLGALAKHGKAKGTAQIVFTPTGGTAATRTETVRFRLAR